MRRAEKEITDRAEIDEIIHAARVCRLGLADNDQPYVVPLHFGYDYPYLYFHSATAGRKLAVLDKNPKVCFEFDHLEKLMKNKVACEWSAAFVSVIGEGVAERVEDFDEKQKAIACIMAQYSSRTFEFPQENLERTSVIRVKVSQMTGKRSG